MVSFFLTLEDDMFRFVLHSFDGSAPSLTSPQYETEVETLRSLLEIKSVPTDLYDLYDLEELFWGTWGAIRKDQPRR